MTEESTLEKLKKAAASAKNAADSKTAKPAEPDKAAGSPKEDDIREAAYKKAMGDAFITKDGVQSVTKQMTENFNDSVKFSTGVFHGSIWAYKHVLRPAAKILTSPIWWPIKKIGVKNLVQSFNKWARPLDEKGVPRLSINRAGFAVTAFAAAALGAASLGPAMIMDTAQDVAWSALSATWWAVSVKTEPLYLHNATPNGTDQYMVVGCDQFPCTDSNSVSFKVDDSLFHDARHFLLHGTPFRPDAVAAAVPPVVNKCEVTYYGWRWRPISRTIDLWPRILEASCTPLNLDNGKPIDNMPRIGHHAQSQLPLTTEAPAPAAVPAP